MARGNPRKPTALKQLQGTTRPCRTNPNEPMPTGPLPDAPPEHLTAEERAAWESLVGIIAPGVAMNSDIAYLTLTAKLFAQAMAGDISDSRLNTLERMLSKFGLNPSDRSRIVAQKEEKNDRFARFAAP